MRTANQLLREKPQRLIRVEADDTVLDAIRHLAENEVGAVLVFDGDALVGVFSERDYARKIILQGRSSAKTRVREIMSSPVISVEPGTDVQECMEMMTERRIRHLPVISGGELLGMISIGDLVRAVIADQREQIDQLNRYISS